MPMIEASLTRRQLLAGSLAAALTPTLARAAARPVTVGFIYVGPKNDYGWNQSHAVAAKKVAQLEGVKIIDRKSTRLNSSHITISYAVFCLKKKKKKQQRNKAIRTIL